MKISRALISVSDKEGLVDFAKGLASRGIEILSTGGTFVTLRAAGVLTVEVSNYTGFPEIMDGRVKTLHPKIHGGILHRRDVPEHLLALEKHEIIPIDMVVVNLYPFEKTVAKEGVTFDEAVEQIDIGGPSMIRAAAKNHEFVSVVVDPGDYVSILEELDQGEGGLSPDRKRQLALKAFSRTAEYDAAISSWFLSQAEKGEGFPSQYPFTGQKITDLRYGENPHQKAAFYRSGTPLGASVARAKVLNGKALSFNNILDLEAALALAKEFTGPAAVVIKHNNPCGCALRATIGEALEAAWEGDPVSAFGSVVACNRNLDERGAEFLAGENRFVEAIIAPGFQPKALDILTTKPKWGKSVRLLETGSFSDEEKEEADLDVRAIYGGFLVQTRDRARPEASKWEVVTSNSPDDDQVRDLLFAQTVAKRVKSNAIVLVKNGQVLGVGAGQMSRVDSVNLAVEKAGDRVQGAVMGSDAFFPFPDGVEAAGRAGVSAVIQPGGSVRDKDVIAAAEKAGMVMVTTGIRHFLH